MRRFLVSLVTIYLLVVAGMFLLQRHMLYYPNRNRPNPAMAGLPNLEEITLTTSDGLALLSWYIPAKNNRPTIVYFHGNSGHIGYRANVVAPYVAAGYGILLLEYRGYGGNPGKPTEQGLYTDAQAALDFLQDKHLQNQCIIVYGESLGSALAVEVATDIPVGGLILQSAFSSVADVAKQHYPFLPVDLLLKDRFDTIGKISQLDVPILFLHGTKDRIVPMKFGKKLYDQANAPKKFIFFRGASHNDLHALELSLHGKQFIDNTCPNQKY